MLNTQPYILGIAGGSASGKTTFINHLKQVFTPDQLCVVSQDNYYRSLSEQHIDANGEVNFDLPEAIDFKRLLKDLRLLKSGKEVQMAEYTFNNPKAFPKTISFKPAPIIIIEGLFIFTSKPLYKMFDLTVFIEAKTEVMFKRRLNRDLVERGIPEEQIRYQWDQHFLPAYEHHMVPHKDRVDLIIVNNDHFKNSFDVMVDHFNRLLSR